MCNGGDVFRGILDTIYELVDFFASLPDVTHDCGDAGYDGDGFRHGASTRLRFRYLSIELQIPTPLVVHFTCCE